MQGRCRFGSLRYCRRVIRKIRADLPVRPDRERRQRRERGLGTFGHPLLLDHTRRLQGRQAFFYRRHQGDPAEDDGHEYAGHCRGVRCLVRFVPCDLDSLLDGHDVKYVDVTMITDARTPLGQSKARRSRRVKGCRPGNGCSGGKGEVIACPSEEDQGRQEKKTGPEAFCHALAGTYACHGCLLPVSTVQGLPWLHPEKGNVRTPPSCRPPSGPGVRQVAGIFFFSPRTWRCPLAS